MIKKSVKTLYMLGPKCFENLSALVFKKDGIREFLFSNIVSTLRRKKK